MVVGQFTTQVDVAVVGAGTAGLAAALEASRRGRSVALVTHGGGARWPSAAPAGDGPAAAMLALLAARGVTILEGRGVLEGDRQLAVPGHPTVPRLRYRRAVLCPDGAPDGLGAAEEGEAAAARATFQSEPIDPWHLHALLAAGVPAAAVVVGAGPLEIAAAAALAVHGSSVTVAAIESDRLPGLGRQFRADLSARLTGLGVQWAEDRDAAAAAAAASSGVAPVVVASPAEPSGAGDLALARADVTADADGRPAVDDAFRTSDPRLTAAGRGLAEPPTCDAVLAAQGIAAAAGACGTPEAWASPLPVHRIDFGHGTEALWCGELAAADGGDGDENAAGLAGEAAAGDAPLRFAAGRAGPSDEAHAADTATCRLTVDAASGLLVGASLVGPGAAARFGELQLAVEMAAEPGDLAGVARALDGPVAAAIALAAATAAESRPC